MAHRGEVRSWLAVLCLCGLRQAISADLKGSCPAVFAAGAAAIHSRTPAQVWPLPPAGAAQVLEREAAKVADPARVAWLVLSKLAQVIGAEV